MFSFCRRFCIQTLARHWIYVLLREHSGDSLISPGMSTRKSGLRVLSWKRLFSTHVWSISVLLSESHFSFICEIFTIVAFLLRLLTLLTFQLSWLPINDAVEFSIKIFEEARAILSWSLWRKRVLEASANQSQFVLVKFGKFLLRERVGNVDRKSSEFWHFTWKCGNSRHVLTTFQASFATFFCARGFTKTTGLGKLQTWYPFL